MKKKYEMTIQTYEGVAETKIIELEEYVEESKTLEDKMKERSQHSGVLINGLWGDIAQIAKDHYLEVVNKARCKCAHCEYNFDKHVSQAIKEA